MRKHTFKHTISCFVYAIKLGVPFCFFSFIGSILCVCNGYLSNLAIGFLMRSMVDNQWDVLLNNFYTASFLLLLSFGLYGIGSIINTWGAFRSREKIQDCMTRSWLYSPGLWAKKIPSGEMLTRFTQDVAQLEDFYFQGFAGKVISPFVNGIAALLTVGIISPILAYIALICGLLCTLWQIAMSEKVKELQSAMRQNTSKVTQVFSNLLTGIIAIRMGNMIIFVRNKLQQVNIKHLKHVRKMAVANANISLGCEIFAVLSVTGSLIYGVYETQRVPHFMADVFLVLPLLPLITTMMSSVGGAYNYLIQVGVNVERIKDIVEGQQENSHMIDKSEFDTSDSAYEDSYLSVRDGSFMDGDVHILSHINITIKRGETVAFVGKVGSGKSTLLHMIIGLYPMHSGILTLKNVDSSRCSIYGWRSQFSFVAQNSYVFSDSIFENIAIGLSSEYRSTLSLEQLRELVESAAMKAGIHDYISELPAGYDTIIGEGEKVLSGGERKRIMLARAFIRNADILVLDEPTASLDIENELNIMETLKKYGKEKTILLTAHKLQTIQAVDKIYVMDAGRIIEEGNHEELMKRKGAYYNLWKAQAMSEDSQNSTT